MKDILWKKLRVINGSLISLCSKYRKNFMRIINLKHLVNLQKSMKNFQKDSKHIVFGSTSRKLIKIRH